MGGRSWLRSLVVLVPLGALAVACSSTSHPGLFVAPGDDAGDLGDADPGFDVPDDTAPLNCSAVEAGLLCACKEIGQRPPLLYLLLDRSGSMNDAPSGSASKWTVDVQALFAPGTGALRKLGNKVRIGVTNFPSSDQDCSAGVEAFPVTQGSATVYDQLYEQLSRVAASGATPTAASLSALLPKLQAIPGPIFVLLATDGGPNCDTSISCGPATCIPCIEHWTFTDASGNPGQCDDTHNCCDPSQFGPGSGGNCLDAAATQAAVTTLANAGIKTFVLGVPGAGPYATDLDALAAAGGTDHYYPATDPTQAGFQAALAAITAKAIDSCTITLDDPPQDPGLTNVIVDGTTIAQDPTNGWSWGPGDATIVIHGTACDEAKQATQIQVAVGCKTVTK